MDLISRQAAIEALERIFDRCEEIEAHLPKGDPDRVGYKMYPDWLKVWKYLHQLPSAQPERWIPVTEGLPEEKKQVLVCDDFGEIYIAEYETLSDGKWRWCESVEYRSLYGIVAWMPLPDPWKGEK